MGDLNGLMRALRDEIALAGKEGASVQAVLAAIDQFYQDKAKQRYGNQVDISSQNVDRAFQQRVWSWLAKDRLISIGESKEGNSLTLDELEARNLKVNPLRMFTTEHQTWITLTGNEKDTRKIPSKSFELLAFIATCREKGVTQPDLARITGQDKRSVPQRTQKLAEAGHIKKIPVLANGANTSLLIHSKFSTQFADINTETRANESVNTELDSHGVLLGRNKHIKAEKEIRSTIKLLEDSKNHLMIWDDLKANCQIEDPVVSRYLAGGIRKLEELGVVVRVRASMSNAQNNAKSNLYRCVQLIRTPTEKDWRLLFQLSKQEQDKLTGSMSVQDIHDELRDIRSMTLVGANRLTIGNDSTNNTEDAIVPLWNPDRLLTHTIHSTLLEAGTTGLSTKDLKRIVTGPFYARPIDRFLDRCVRTWQKSQPLNLRHLAIVRDSAQIGKTSFYVHFVHDAFGVKVESGETFWGAIQSFPELNQVVSADEYGFETHSSSMFAGNRNDLTLKKVLEATQRGDQSVYAPGTIIRPKGVSKKSQHRAGHKSQNVSANGTQRDQGSSIPFIPLGRPRKYPNTSNTLDFSKMSSAQIKKAVMSQKRAQEYLRKKAHKEVELRVYRGMPKNEAEKIVITELGLTPESYIRNTITEPKVSKPRIQGHSSKRKREIIIPSYFPSILAHTFPLHSYEELPSEPLKKPQNKRRKILTTRAEYLPSVLAHTLPINPPHARSRAGQSFMTPKSKGKRRAFNSNTIPISDSKQSSSDLNSLASPSLPLDREKPSSSKIISSTNETNKGRQLLTASDISYSRAAPNQPNNSQQANEIHRKAQDEIRQNNNTANHFEAPPSHIENGLATESSLKRKASTNEAFESLSKKQRNTSTAESSIMTTQESIIETEHSNSSRASVIVTVSPSCGFGATGSTVAAPRPHTPTDENLLSNMSQGLSPITDKESSPIAGTETASPVKKKPRRRMAPFGGTIAAMRKLIILDIVKNCGGIFPGDAELAYPFITAFARKFPDAKPDSRTIKLAKTTLIGESRLKQICFSYKSSTGTNHTKTIITLPEILETSNQVKELQDAMIKAHPYFYFPPGTDIRADLMPRSASLDTDVRVGKRATCTKDLPVISAIVVPQHEMTPQSQSQRRNSITRTDSVDSPQAHTAKSMPSKSKQKNAPNQDSIANEEYSQGENPHQEHIVKKQYVSKRAGDSGPQDGMIRKKPRLTRLDSQTQNQPPEVVFQVPMRFEASEISRETQSRISSSARGSSLQAQLRHGSLEDKVPADQAIGDPIPAEQIPVDQVLEGQVKGNQTLADQLPADHVPTVYMPATSMPAVYIPPAHVHMVDPRNYPPLEAQYHTRITSGTNSQFVPTTVAPVQNPYLASIPSNPLPLTTDIVTGNERYQPGSSATNSGDIFVHYPFPTENFIAVPVRNNPVGRKRIERPPKEVPKKKKARSKGETAVKASSAQQSLEQPIGESDGGKSQKTRAKRTRTVGLKPSALELHEKRQEKTPGIRYSKSSQTQTRQIEFRRERHNWEPENDRKLLIATLFCHVACGGLREENHWAIISKMLNNKYDRELCRRRWTAVRTKYRGDLEIIYSELRSALLDSYEKDEIPKIDYAHIWKNDWVGIMTWAMDKIENPGSEDVELPASREAFESAFLIQEFPPRDGPDFFENKRVASIPVRHSVLNASARVFIEESKSPVTELGVAKSYVLANVLTPESTYHTEKAREKLLEFSERTIEQAINCLLADKSISQTNRGRAAPGRTYDVTRSYLKAMEWKLSVAHFKYAAAFKEILDGKLEIDGRMQYKQAFGNGEMITLINLLADGLLELDGKDIPNKKFGLSTEGYKTRNIDKKAWNFAIHMKPTEDYIKGYPCRPLPQPPTMHRNQSEDNTNHPANPIWIDINGGLLPTMWDLAVAAVATILVINIGSTAKNIAEKLQPCVAHFEVQLIMQWLVDAGAAEWKDETRDCLGLKTWWWSVITTPIAKSANAEEATMIAGQPMQH